MKKGSLQKVMAIILSVTMITGMLMVDTALAMDGFILGDDSENRLVDDTEATAEPSAPQSSTLDPSGADTTEDFTSIIPATNAPLGALSGLAEMGGGLTISVTSSQTEVNDGDQYSFTVAIADSDLTTEPNIKPGDELTIKIPEFLSSDDLDAALKNCFAYFEKDYAFDEDTHTLKLRFKENSEGTWANIQFSITLEVDTIGYDGDGKGEISVGIGDMVESGTDISVGTGTGSGSGEEHEEPYIVKNIWSNYKNSEYGVDGSYVMRDPDAPLGYAVGFGVHSNYSGTVVMRDDMSNGALTLCDVNGDVHTTLDKCVSLFIDGEKQSGVLSGETIAFSDTALGNIVIAKDGSGFTVTCSNPQESEEPARIVPVVVRYNALVTGNVNDISNTVELVIDDKVAGSDQTTIRRYDNQGLVINKKILSDGVGNDSIDIDENTARVTFRLVFTQYGTGSLYVDGDVINFDLLEDCFLFDPDSVSIQEGAPFRLETDPENPQKINIVKRGNAPIANGVYFVDFTVTVKADALLPGEEATNRIGNTVFIRRKAKLSIHKKWIGEKEIGNGAFFELLDGNQVISNSGAYSAGDIFTLYIKAKDVREGLHNYTLRETVDENSEYIAAKDKTVAIEKNKETGKVTIVSIDGVLYEEPSGTAEIEVENVPDSGKGSLTFKKYAESMDDTNLLDGGKYELWQVGTDGAEDKLLETFSTVNGVKVFEDLAYGTYYVKECSAPSGYLITGNGLTPGVQLKKSEPHKSISLVNKQFKDGRITIIKKDEKGNPLTGVVFTLTPASGKPISVATDASGVAVFANLTAGIYTVTETLPFGYSGYTGSVIVNIDTEASSANVENAFGVTAESDGSNLVLSWENVRQYGQLRVIKWDRSMRVRLAGAVFELSGNGIEPVQVTTGSNGAAEFQNLPFGEYLLKEITAPAGYVISDELRTGVAVTIGSVQTIELSFANNTQKGSIDIAKVAEDGETPLSGAVFGLYRAVDAVDPIAVKTTGNDGKALFDELEAGTYYVKEISAPTGYILDSTVYTFVVGDGAQAAWAHRKTVANEKKRFSLQLRKTEETGSTPLPNAEFRLTGNGFNLTAVSDEKGLVVFEGLTYGSYTITETKAPSGYVPAVPIQITIDDSNTYRPDHIVAVSEAIKNQHTQLTVIKWDDSGVETLNGAIFRIKNADGKYVIANGEDGAYIFSGFSDSDDGATRFVTENSGSFSLEYLPMGSYTLEEIKAPDGFIILTGSVDFSIQNEKTSVSINNTRIRSTLRLVKSDENGKLLPDVGFVLRNSSGGYVTAQLENGAYTYTGIAETEAGATRFITDARGEIALNGLVWGTYYLDEASAPDGLVPQTDIRVEVTAETHNIEIQLNIVNRIEYGELQFRKTAEDGKTLAGAVFKLELIKESGNEYSAKYPFFAVSDEDGIVHFENIPYGVYRLTEYLAPAGYEPNKDARYIRFGNASVPEGIEITEPEELAGDWINSPIEREYTVRKVSTDGTALSGAVFEILDKEQQRIGKDGLFLAVNDGVGASIKLPLGVYYLKEIHAPENYLLNESPIRFSVTAEGPNEITVENAPCTGSLRIIKADEKDNQKLLSGAEFTIYGKEDYIQNGANAEAVYKITTNADGKAVLNGIPFGDYAVAETKAPHGYELTREPQYFTVTNVSESGQNSGTNITLTFENELSRYVLCITKEDIRTRKKISGATFAVAGNGFYTTATVDASGSVIVEAPAIGTYYITELTAPEGYTLDPNTYPVEVTGHSPEHAVPVAEFISRDYPTAVRLTKVDENGKELTGAVFTLYAVKDTEKLPVSLTKTAEGVYAYDSLGSATELPAGNIEIFGLPIGEYVFSEMKAPSGYMNLGDIHFNVDADRYDQALEVYAENLPIQRGVAVCKETIHGLRLGGAVFGLFADGNDTPLREETTSASGYAFFSGLEPGSYVIREITPPKGYQKIDTEFAFTIDENGDLHSTHAFIQNSSELFFVLTVKNAPIEHGFRLQKISAANDELALEGAQFRILGNGINKTYVTGSDGLTEVIMLPVGSYTLTEQKAPAGYLADGRGYALEIKVDGVYVDNVKLDDALPTYTIKNAPQNFLLRIEKRDRQNRQPLEGVAFSVVNRDGKKYSLVTDQYGMTETIALTPGTYSVSEVIAAPGYELPLAGWSFTVSEGGSMQAVSNAAEFTFIDGQLTLVLENEKTSGNLMINKYDAEDSSPLAGASFEVLNESGERVRFMLRDGIYSFTESADALDLLVTDARGIALLQELPFGTYTVREVSAPVGYEISTFQNQINITEQDKTEMLQVPNQKCMRNVKVFKQSAGDEQVPLAGATFALYKVNGDIRTFVEEATTGYDGMVRFTVPYGEYMIVETKAPAGYELSGRQPVSFVVDDSTADDAEFTFTFENERSRYGLAIVKQDAKDEHKLLAGAEFAITDSRGFTKIVTTGDDGRAVMEDLVYDDYSVQEIKAPEGYALNDEIYIIHKEELRHGQIIEVNVPDTYILGSVVLKKVDHEDPEKALEGAEFIVKNEEGTQLKWTRAGDIYKMDPEGETDTVEAGNVTLTELPAGQYTLIETKAPAGYVPLDEERVFSITEEQMSEPLEIVVENLLRRTAVSITKIDDKQHELRLSGAEFTLYRLVNGEAEETVSMKITNENGIAAFTDLTVGTYRLVETKAPTGYKLWKNPVDFKIDDDGKVIVGNAGYEIPEVDQVFTFSMVNEAITHEVVIQKISAETGDALPGAVFRITGNVEADVTTNENGVAKIELPYGEYQLQEIVAPDGYVLDQTIHTLTVNEEGFFVDGVLQSAFAVTIENAPVEHDFQLHKQSEADGRPLAGAEFTIVGNGKTFTLTTDPMGNTKVVRLTPGTYTITEKRAPAGYKRPLAGWTLTVEAGGTISVKGDKAVVVSYNTHSILIIKNSKETGYEIGKTGETGNHTQLLCGALLMIFSFIGLLILMIHDRHKKNSVCAR